MTVLEREIEENIYNFQTIFFILELFQSVRDEK